MVLQGHVCRMRLLVDFRSSMMNDDGCDILNSQLVLK